ncbi:MAG: CRISPR-associated helicase Cas3' [Holophagales bacterium]|jgi:CRISPR-associated endonuclease/helicase Cas3|nr:CRISPR-associated helicase Cas3' [Holophagales bacterium]
MGTERLLAKSWDSTTGTQFHVPTIAWHTECALDCAKRLLRLRGGDAIHAMGLPQSAMVVLERIVLFAVWLHDIGKCAFSFQQILEMKTKIAQPFRHEAVSWYIISQILDDYLSYYIPDKTERWMIAVCVAGHHRSFDIQDRQYGAIRDYLGKSELFLSHKDFHALFGLVPTDCDSREMPHFDDRTLSAICLHKAISKAVIDYDDCIFPIIDANQKKIISLAKSFLIAADISASALSGNSIGFDWIDKKLEARAESDARKGSLEKTLGGKPLREFQEAVAQSKAPWTFLKAGCGTGKTVAACAWAAENYSERQLWLTYPTTGTATEGFIDYVKATELEGSLQHSKALWDIEELELDVGIETDENELPQREIALRGWGADTVVATVDTVLGIMQNHRAGHYAYPGILKGALVFDEIHAYDKFLFGSLLRFLETHPNIPCLFMTASLQESREQALRELHYRIFNKELEIRKGPEDLENLPRYTLIKSDSKNDPWPDIKNYIQQGKKVLWVSNTVDQCIAVGREAQKKGMKPLFYHSRYKYSDRIKRHRAIIDSFKNDDSFFATTTQVAEMSLNISADMLITDIAPVSAMIQRLGRLNRKADATSLHEPFPFIVYEQQRHEPYTSKDIESAKEWLNRLPDRISQQDLINCWLPDVEDQSRIYANWLDESLWTRKSSLREASKSISVVLEKDLGYIRKGEKPISYYQINMPRRKIADMESFRGRRIATDSHIRYLELEGASWVKK